MADRGYLYFNSTIELKDNTVVIVLGASGDLAKKKTVSRGEAHGSSAFGTD